MSGMSFCDALNIKNITIKSGMGWTPVTRIATTAASSLTVDSSGACSMGGVSSAFAPAASADGRTELDGDLSWLLWADTDCLDSSEIRWWERVCRSYDECANGALAYQGLEGNTVFYNPPPPPPRLCIDCQHGMTEGSKHNALKMQIVP